MPCTEPERRSRNDEPPSLERHGGFECLHCVLVVHARFRGPRRTRPGGVALAGPRIGAPPHSIEVALESASRSPSTSTDPAGGWGLPDRRAGHVGPLAPQVVRFSVGRSKESMVGCVNPGRFSPSPETRRAPECKVQSFGGSEAQVRTGNGLRRRSFARRRSRRRPPGSWSGRCTRFHPPTWIS